MKTGRYSLFVLLCSLSLITLASTSPANAFAASDYGVKTTTQLRLGGTGDAMDCYGNGSNMALQWGQIMQTADPSTPYSYQNTWNWASDYNNAQSKLTSFVNRFHNSVNSESSRGWAVSQASMVDRYSASQPEFETFHKMIRIWAFDPDTTFTLVEGGLHANKTVYYTDYFLNPGANCRWQAWNYSEVGTTSMDFLYNKFLFVNAASIAYPEDYSGDLIPSQYIPPTPTYVAMGDSFSSGEGNTPFESGTDQDGVNECHRSGAAYPNWLEQTPSLYLGGLDFVACSGATTANVLHGGSSRGAWNEPPQVDALSADTEVVTITIGGNDIGFKEFATECGFGDCDSSTVIYATTLGKIHNELPGKLEEVLNSIASKTDDAEVFVIGYPYTTPGSNLTSLPYQCNYLDSSSGQGLDSLAARDVTGALNGEIKDAVDGFVNTTSDSVFTFVDPNLSVDGTFDGHDVCQGVDSYFYNITPNDVIGNGYIERIFHPNINGQYEYYNIAKGEIDLVR